MGLDWNPLARPRSGFEEEFSGLIREIRGERPPRSRGVLARLFGGRELSASERERCRTRLQQISDPPYALLGAPRVGHDQSADQWLLESMERAGKRDEFDAAREKMSGYFVLDLLPPCDGFPGYSNYGAYEGLDRYSFRGSFLADVEDVLGPELMAEAYRILLSDELQRFGQRLLERARGFASARGLEEVEHAPPGEFEEGSDRSRADILFAAGRWCLYWSGRGHGLEPWF